MKVTNCPYRKMVSGVGSCFGFALWKGVTARGNFGEMLVPIEGASSSEHLSRIIFDIAFFVWTRDQSLNFVIRTERPNFMKSISKCL